MATRKFDAAALSIVAQGLREDEIPFAVREFQNALGRVIRSIEDLGGNPQKFSENHQDPNSPVWKIGAHLANKPFVRNSDQVFTELRTLCNRLKRLRIQKQSDTDVTVIVGTSEFILASELFLEAA